MERFHLGQHFIHETELPAVLGAAPVLQEAVHLVDQEHCRILRGLPEGTGDVLLAFTHPFGYQVGSPNHVQWSLELLGKPAAIGGLAGSRRPVQAEPPGSGPRQSGSQSGQVGIRVNEGRVIDPGQTIGVRSGNRLVPLGFQRIADQ
ncbi:hypothetical protein D9M72_594360 [compost metagenome]